MFAQLTQRYLSELDLEMRRVIDAAPVETPGFATLLRYPLGWVDEVGNSYNQPTGKRIRPMLLMLCAEAAGGVFQTALPAAAAVELLHNFSLIHDDIEDNSPTRHGRRTVWQVWGSANAINAGDAIFALSYIALSGLSERGVPAETVLAVWRTYNRTVLELTRGQHLDMRFEHQQVVSVEEYISMISGKTAALVSCCAEIGALIGSNDVEKAACYASFGLNLGLAFQIRDDLLGIWGKPEETGKSAATDIISRKKSLPVLYGLSQSEALTELYRSETLNDHDVLRAVALLDSVKAQDYTRQQEQKFYARAMESLEQASPTGDAAQGLQTLIHALFNRNR